MKVRREDVTVMAFMSLMAAPLIAFMTFDFMFPNITTPSLEKNMMVMFAISILAGMPAGYFIKRTDVAMVTVILYVVVGYALALLYYTMPYLIYDIDIVVPGLYYVLFFRITVVLLFIFVLGGFIGAVFGQLVRDSIKKETTRLTWDEGE